MIYNVDTLAPRAIFTAIALCLTAFAFGARAEEGHGHILAASLAVGETEIVSTEFKFSPQSAPIAAGRPIALILDNRNGETEHGIFVPALGLRIFARAGEVVRKIVVFDKPGQYEYICDLPGHREAGMEGKLIVGADDDRRPSRVLGSAGK